MQLMKTLLAAGMLSNACAIGQSVADTLPISVPFSAEVWRFDQLNGYAKKTARITANQHGIRVSSKQRLGGEIIKTVFIQSFNTDANWIMKPANRTFASLPVQASSDTKSDKTFFGIMATEPCLSPSGSKNKRAHTGATQFGGERVEIWECKGANQKVVQWYSEEWKMVVHERLPSQRGTKLRRIRKSNIPEDFFRPPEDFAEISLREFYTGSPSLTPYNELPQQSGTAPQ